MCLSHLPHVSVRANSGGANSRQTLDKDIQYQISFSRADMEISTGWSTEVQSVQAFSLWRLEKI